MHYSQLTKSELEKELSELTEQYNSIVARGLKLDMSRGKPGADQLCLSEGVLKTVTSNEDCLSENGADCRNYGILDGLPEAKRLFAELLGELIQGLRDSQCVSPEIRNATVAFPIQHLI